MSQGKGHESPRVQGKSQVVSQKNTCRDSCKKRPIGTVSVHARHVDVVMAEAREEKEIVAYVSLGIVTSSLESESPSCVNDEVPTFQRRRGRQKHSLSPGHLESLII